MTYNTIIKGRPDIAVFLYRERGEWVARVGNFGEYKLTPEGHLRRGKKILAWRVVAPAGVVF